MMSRRCARAPPRCRGGSTSFTDPRTVCSHHPAFAMPTLDFTDGAAIIIQR